MKTETDPRRYLSVSETAYELRLSPQTVRRAISRGDLPAVQLGEHAAIRVPVEALQPVGTTSGEGAAPGGPHEEPSPAKSRPAGDAGHKER